MLTIDGASKIAVADMAFAVVSVETGQQQTGVPGHQASKEEEDYACLPAQMCKCKGQGCICCITPTK